MSVLTYILGGIVLVATGLPFIKTGLWWIRVFDFPRMQVAIIGIAAIALFLVFVRKFNLVNSLFLLGLAAAVVIQTIQIWPHTEFAKKQTITALNPKTQNCLSLLIANVYQYNRHAEQFLQLIHEHNPDLVLTVETDDWWATQLASLADRYPYRVEQPQDNTYGMMLYSRLRLHETAVHNLIDSGIPSVYAKVELRSGQLVDLYGLHPMPPHPIDNQNTIERDAELVVVARMIQGSVRPTIVAGDLNDVAWSHTTRLFQRISGLLDPRIGRGLYNTFPTSIPFFRFPLDHIFHSRDFLLLDLERLPNFGSDHFPMYVSLCYQPQRENLQRPPEPPDTTDMKEAKETIKEAKDKAASDSQ